MLRLLLRSKLVHGRWGRCLNKLEYGVSPNFDIFRKQRLELTIWFISKLDGVEIRHVGDS
jgi:hypothetical protein